MSVFISALPRHVPRHVPMAPVTLSWMKDSSPLLSAARAFSSGGKTNLMNVSKTNHMADMRMPPGTMVRTQSARLGLMEDTEAVNKFARTRSEFANKAFEKFDPRMWATAKKPRNPNAAYGYMSAIQQNVLGSSQGARGFSTMQRRNMSTMHGSKAKRNAATMPHSGEFLDSADATRMIRNNARASAFENAPMIVKPFVNFGYFASDILFSIPFPVALVLLAFPIGMYKYKPLNEIVEQGKEFTDAATHRVPHGTMELLDKRQMSYKRGKSITVGEEGSSVLDEMKCETERGAFVLSKLGLDKEGGEGLGEMLKSKKIVAMDVVDSKLELDENGVEKNVDITKERTKMFKQRIHQAKGIGGGLQGHNSPGVKAVDCMVCRATGHVFINYTDGNRKNLLPVEVAEDGTTSPLYVEVMHEGTDKEETIPMRYFKVYKNTVMAKKNLHSFLVDYQGRLIELGESDREHYEIFWDRLRRKNESTGFQSFGII